MIHQHVFDVVRMRNQVSAEMEEPQAGDVAILARRGSQKFQRVTPERTEHTIKRARFRTGREFRGQRGLHLGMLIAGHNGVNAASFGFEIRSTPAARPASVSRRVCFRR